MNYQVYPPAKELAEFVKCFWTLDDDGHEKPGRQKVLPDGCMEMIFHYGDRYEQFFEDGTSVIQPRSFVFGQISKYIEIAPTGVSGIISARFLPNGLIPFLKIPVSALQNKAVNIETVFGEKGNLLERDVLEAKNNDQRIKLIESFLLSQLTNTQTFDMVTKSCVDVIFEAQGQIGIKKLANKMSINRRNMERRFTSIVGLSPKQLSRVVRLQATLKMLEQKNFSSLTSLALENGYYDQAHFIKDFREFTGTSPKLFFASNLKLSSLFIAAG